MRKPCRNRPNPSPLTKPGQFSRRKLLRDAAVLASACAAGIGENFAAAAGSTAVRVSGYGSLKPDPNRRLDLPAGFRYQVISRVGQRMDDGLLVPGLADGMHAFEDSKGLTRILRNHELNPGSPQTAFDHLADGPPATVRRRMYDAAVGRGGVTTMVFNTKKQKLTGQFLSLAGTLRNCAGGPTPWGSWISCEEILLKKGEHGALRDHGFNFEVPADADGLVDAVALADMGRFNHEAIAVGPGTGIVYQTEDRAQGLFYRFLPESPGQLRKGGRLQALVLRDSPSAFTGNWQQFGTLPVGERLPVAWVTIDNVLAPDDDLRLQGRSRGAAAFARGEGMIAETTRDGEPCVWFVCTAGGRNKRGQLFCYRPGPHEGSERENKLPGTLELFAEPNDSRLLNHGDNLCIAPNTDIVICEDNKDNQRLMGITRHGGIYELARNAAGDSEFAGATFSPDRSTLFVNLQNPGLTFAVTGPWPSRSSSPA